MHPVAHCTLRDAAWLHAELARLERDGVHLAMIAPALVDGRPLSHPDHDAIWRAFVDHGVTPVFHVADQRRAFDDAWYTQPEDFGVPPLESVFLWTAAALACTDLILNGTLERLPDLRIGIVELSAIWVPMFLMMLDGGSDFTAKLNGRPLVELAHAAERLLPPPGARVVVLVRAARAPHPPDRRPLHVLLRLPALRRHRTPLADYTRQRASRSDPTTRRASSTTTSLLLERAEPRRRANAAARAATSPGTTRASRRASRCASPPAVRTNSSS